MTEDGQREMVVRGGRGGKGNAAFVSGTNRFPLLAEEGESGQIANLELRLKLLADVGIVGAPNAGKSSLLAAVTSARPRIADYPFSTLEPVLGVADHRAREVVLVDIPGLVEGAHTGVGLGHDFLRHVSRTRVLVHVVDGTAAEPVADYVRVRGELGLFDAALATKPEVVALNKVDVQGVEERWCSGLVGEAASAMSVHPISVATGQGLPGLLDAVLAALDLAEAPAAVRAAEDQGGPVAVVSPHRLGKKATVKVVGEEYVVGHRGAARLAAMVDRDSWDARAQLFHQFHRLGVMDALQKAGIGAGDMFRVGGKSWEWEG